MFQVPLHDKLLMCAVHTGRHVDKSISTGNSGTVLELVLLRDVLVEGLRIARECWVALNNNGLKQDYLMSQSGCKIVGYHGVEGEGKSLAWVRK